MDEQNNTQNTDVPEQNAAQQPAPTQGEPAQAPQPAATPKQEEAMSNAPDRTKEQFEKLLESNKRLYDANMLLRQEMEQQRTAPQAPQPGPQRATEINPDDFIEEDPSTGQKYINDQRLKAKLEEIQKKADQAEKAIQNYMKTNEDREIERQNQEAFDAFPDLDPSSKKFDANFHKQVRGALADSMFNPEDYNGRPLSFKEAASFVRTQYPTQTAQPKASDATAETEKAEAEKSQAAQTQKEQASTQANSQPRAAQQVSDDEELESLRYRTRYQNDDWALAERLKFTEHILPRDAEEV
jgi:hypothetical protein